MIDMIDMIVISKLMKLCEIVFYLKLKIKLKTLS